MLHSTGYHHSKGVLITMCVLTGIASVITFIGMLNMWSSIAAAEKKIHAETQKREQNTSELKKLESDVSSSLGFMAAAVVPWLTCCILSIVLCVLYAKNYRPVLLACGALGFCAWPLLVMIAIKVVFSVFAARSGLQNFALGPETYGFFVLFCGVFILTIISSSLVLITLLMTGASS
jgi:hypothetical protein